jgi:hypothetical protein
LLMLMPLLPPFAIFSPAIISIIDIDISFRHYCFRRRWYFAAIFFHISLFIIFHYCHYMITLSPFSTYFDSWYAIFITPLLFH